MIYSDFQQACCFNQYTYAFFRCRVLRRRVATLNSLFFVFSSLDQLPSCESVRVFALSSCLFASSCSTMTASPSCSVFAASPLDSPFPPPSSLLLSLFTSDADGNELANRRNMLAVLVDSTDGGTFFVLSNNPKACNSSSRILYHDFVVLGICK